MIYNNACNFTSNNEVTQPRQKEKYACLFSNVKENETIREDLRKA